MDKDIVELIEKRRKKDSEIRGYQESFLKSPLSLVIDFCFIDAQKWSYNQDTLKNFRRYLNELAEKHNVISLDAPVEQLRQEAHLISDRILLNSSLSKMQKKLRIHALIFLFKFIQEQTGGIIKGLKMPQELVKITPARDKSKTAASFDEVHHIFKAAESISHRDSLILKMIFETEQSLHVILSLKCEDINFDTRIVREINRIISTELINLLNEYVQSTASIRGNFSTLFISNQGKPLYRTQVQKTLDKANQEAQLPYRITIKMIQRSKLLEKQNITRKT